MEKPVQQYLCINKENRRNKKNDYFFKVVVFFYMVMLFIFAIVLTSPHSIKGEERWMVCTL